MAPRLNIPPLTRGLILGLLVYTLLNAGARYRKWTDTGRSTRVYDRTYYAPYLTIVPGQSIIYPWVFLSATLAEQNALGLIVTGASLFYGGRYLERAWSSREYSKFIVIIALIPNIMTFFLYIILYILTSNVELATTAISGGIAIQAAFLVSFKQLVPEHTVTLFRGLVSMRVKHFPAIFLAANTVSGLILGTDTAMLLAWCGFIVSWTYLRFYRISPSLFTSSTGMDMGTGSTVPSELIKGDASDTFAFAAFWPDVVQPPIATVSDAVYDILVSLRVCTPFSAADVDAGNEHASAREGGSELPSLLNAGRDGGARGEAERRRALALRALDQRLNTHAQQGKSQTTKAPEPTILRQHLDDSEESRDVSARPDPPEQARVGGVEDGKQEA